MRSKGGVCGKWSPVLEGGGAVYSADGFVVGSGSSFGCLGVVRFEEDVGMFEYACVVEVQTSVSAYILDDVIEEMELEGTEMRRVVGSENSGGCAFEESDLSFE